MKERQNDATSYNDTRGDASIVLPIQDGIDEWITKHSISLDCGRGMSNIRGVTHSHSTSTPVNKAEGCIIKAETHSINEMEHFPGPGINEYVNETSNTIDGVQKEIQVLRSLIF